MDQDGVVARVTPQGVQFIVDCIKKGYEDYSNPEYYSDEAKRDHTPSVAAACRNCHIVARAKRMSVEMQGFIQIHQKRGRTTFVLGCRSGVLAVRRGFVAHAGLHGGLFWPEESGL